MKKIGQTLSEYVVLLAAISLALTSMQLYFRRSIQSVVKIAADEIGTQKEGVATFDSVLEYVARENTQVNSTSIGRNREEKLPGAAVTRAVNETSWQEGGISFAITREKED